MSQSTAPAVACLATRRADASLAVQARPAPQAPQRRRMGPWNTKARPSDCTEPGAVCSRACRYALPSGCCALALSELGPHTLGEIGQHFGITRERVRQIEVVAIGKVRQRAAAERLDLRLVRREGGITVRGGEVGE